MSEESLGTPGDIWRNLWEFLMKFSEKICTQYPLKYWVLSEEICRRKLCRNKKQIRKGILWEKHWRNFWKKCYGSLVYLEELDNPLQVFRKDCFANSLKNYIYSGVIFAWIAERISVEFPDVSSKKYERTLAERSK